MEFRLLGPVEVVIADEPVAIASARQQIVLTMLLLEANQVVPVSRLVDALWDDRPPRTARSQVQICVSGLRTLLNTDDRGEILQTRPPGYLIRVEDDELDLRRFERLVARAAEVAAAQPAEAVRDLRAALALWRGPAASGVRSEIVQAAATMLGESRLAALEQCLQLELDLGNHHEVVGELTGLVAEHPLRERFRGQLMLALYRSGRQAEALEVFRQTRRTFVDELGLDPGQDLQNLERAILTRDPELELPDDVRWGARVEPEGVSFVPRQLPAEITDFIGHREVVEEVCAVLSSRARAQLPVVTLTGKGGVGKSALAVHAAHQLLEHYPDGQLFARLHDGEGQRSQPYGLLERFLRALGVAPSALPDTLEGRAAMYRSCLAERRVLIVLDDMVLMNQAIPLLPGSEGCGVIITTRNRLPWPQNAHQVELDMLAESAGIELVTRIIGQERAKAEPESVTELVALCDSLPLALHIVAAKLASRQHWPISAMVQRLRDERRRLDELDLEGVSVRATLSFSYDSLSDDGRRLFRRLGVLGEVSFAAWTAAPLLGVAHVVAEDLLEDLVAARLVEAEQSPDGFVRFHLHDLIRIFATELLTQEDTPAERQQALGRLLGCWLFLAREAHSRVYGGDHCVLHGDAELWRLPPEVVEAELGDDPLGWFRREHTALVSATMQAARSGISEVCWDLAMTSVTLFESGLHTDDWRETHDAALKAARAAGDRRGEGAMSYSLGLLELTRDLAEAGRYLRESLEIFQELREPHGLALALSELAFVHRQTGDYPGALALCDEALAHSQRVADPVCEANLLRNMAQIHLDQQHRDVAVQLLDEAFIMSHKAGATRVTAQIEYQRAELYLREGHLERARIAYAFVLRAARESGDLIGQGYALLGLGSSRGPALAPDSVSGSSVPGSSASGSELAEALELAEREFAGALELAERTRDALLRGRVLLALGTLHARADGSRALGLLAEALEVFGELGDAAVWQARALEPVGALRLAQGDRDAAARAWRQALELIGDVDPALTARLTTALDRLG
ncbi:AfsR/SARP family transcriptional regulator [Nonomuraea sediminis]|uniref:AfsR/SARP family transcriptional regulator n=1 Tax=Nonomuraea sediminis TaxID=2835864 RepID=UPI001BDCB4F2|nr:AfsR/SARP family transcriptional regulator [Nonomuraea sediminis]